ncbi:tetratricopeptide repeat protein [Thioalkalivibrio paradoxus]|uniref:Tetratricopeptide repeat protein n=1 Tax=Thioalkalivibrio paradoxus ARh 1 TaxID=713585 RepID=W0DSY1_9GAMM|nr:hypothetical protein [Thioalkalivibrio paradoxus]AHE99980.1 hypothetical protein THITH_05545 [Thioalkalivibrio paradoxus ARh 1]
MNARAMRGLVLPLAGLLAAGIAWAEYRGLRSVDPQQPAQSLAAVQANVPWGGLAGRQLAASLEPHWRRDPPAVDEALAWHLRHYPLDPWRWADRARLARLQDADPDAVLAHLDAALAAQPHNRELLWRAATITQQLGRVERTEEHLRDWLAGQPAGTHRALFVAMRWIDDPAQLLDRILPPGDPYLEAAIAAARQHGRLDLAAEAWERLSRPRPPGDRALLDFVDLALAQGDHERAAWAWAETFPDYRYGMVPNADFRHEPASPRGLHWRIRVPAGARVVLDPEHYFTEPASLRLDFDGTENLRLTAPSVRIPVPAGVERWTVSGHWRAEGLTTRALPYLSAWADGGRRTRVDAPGSEFDWQPFRVELDTPEGGRMLHLQLRRDPPARDFDRYLAGRLWLDALRVEPAPLQTMDSDEP